MLSGNGRHRRPRQAPAFLVTAGVTSAGVALPLLGAGAAQAVDGGTWDLVAACESGGNWLADGGNGYYGGLQLPLRLWTEFGGEEFADRPDLASRSQQIAVAERILGERGPRAFPACAVTSGLVAEYRAEREAAEVPGSREGAGTTGGAATEGTVDDGADADRGDDAGAEDAGAEDAGDGRGDDLPQQPQQPRSPEGSGVPDRNGPAGADGAADAEVEASQVPDGAQAPEGAKGADDPERSDRSEQAGVSGGPAGESSGGRHRGAPDPGEADRAEVPGGGRHADGGRDGLEGVDGPTGEFGEPGEGLDYEVARGDSLYAIAGSHDVPGGWPALYERNASVIGDDPDHILPGQLLDLDTLGTES